MRWVDVWRFLGDVQGALEGCSEVFARRLGLGCSGHFNKNGFKKDDREAILLYLMSTLSVTGFSLCNADN